jgi:hypothetical protein
MCEACAPEPLADTVEAFDVIARLASFPKREGFDADDAHAVALAIRDIARLHGRAPGAAIEAPDVST